MSQLLDGKLMTCSRNLQTTFPVLLVVMLYSGSDVITVEVLKIRNGSGIVEVAVGNSVGETDGMKDGFSEEVKDG